MKWSTAPCAAPLSGKRFRFRIRSSGKFGLSGEIWHFTQPFLHGNAVGNLWAVNYNAKKTWCWIAASTMD